MVVNGPMVCAHDPFMAEALTCNELKLYISCVKSRGIRDVHIESDCLNLVCALNCEGSDRSYVGSIVHACRSFSSSFFILCFSLHLSFTRTNRPCIS